MSVHNETGVAPVGRVVLQKKDGIAWMRISNPARYNAMSLSMWHELAELIMAAEDDSQVRVIVVTGEGSRAFVAGADITEFATLRDSHDQIDAYGRAVSKAQSILSTCDKPTVALINGVCMGGGIGIALACDLRFCTSTARFRMPAARLGLGYDVDGLRRAVDVMGYPNAVDIFFSARTFDGNEAQRLSLVNRCFSAEHFELQVQAVLSDMSGNAPLTLRAAKRAFRHIVGDPTVTLTDVNAAIDVCFKSADYREGQQAFKEKRTPQFQGR